MNSSQSIRKLDDRAMPCVALLKTQSLDIMRQAHQSLGLLAKERAQFKMSNDTVNSISRELGELIKVLETR